MPKLPNFFLAGAPKAGTTSLYHYLDQHPQIYMSPIKEPNFFASEIRAENFDSHLGRRAADDAIQLREYLAGPMRKKRFGGIVTQWDDYLRLFANATDETALGEASVCYLWSPTASAQIAERIPAAKIIVMLRDPAAREFSEYVQCLGTGAVQGTFREYIRNCLDRRSPPFCTHYPSLDLGFYAEPLRRYIQLFGPNVWIGFYEDFCTRALEIYRDICRFLGVAADFAPDMRQKHLKPTHPGHATQMEPTDRRYLVDLYRDDIAKLATLVNRNLDHWLRYNPS